MRTGIIPLLISKIQNYSGGNFINLIYHPQIMWPFNRLRLTKSKYRNYDKEYPTIQQLLKDNWFTDEKGIVKGLPYSEAVENNTHGLGEIRADYATLKKVFGKPTIEHGNGDGKVRKYWIVKIDGIVCTIYDWKQGKSYRGYRPLKNARWSVGGSHSISRRLVQGVIDEYTLRYKFEAF